jgi:hypothetical protein
LNKFALFKQRIFLPMNKRCITALLLIFALSCAERPDKEAVMSEPQGKENIAYKWGAMALEATALDTERYTPRPTVTSRYLGLIFTATFDAWSRYDQHAIPVYLQDVPRRPGSEHTLSQKEVAVSYAAYRTLNEYYPDDQPLFRGFMMGLGLDPDDMSMDPADPVGIGNLAAKAVIEARKNDGANQYGEEPGSNGRPYFDYTGYRPVNSPDENVDINRWQPKYFVNEEGQKYAPGCLTPYWQEVQPITLDSASQFRPGPPPMVGSEQLEREVREVIEMQANLTDTDKALVEFMRDGPKSVQQAGHWLKFAQDVSRRDAHTLDEDVKMYFLNQITAMDAFIASWDSKMFYDFARPYALVHDYYQDEVIKAWGGPGKGMIEVPGKEWRPYSPESFLCPPFPSYTSGHSTVSGACGEALRLFTGDDYFGEEVQLVPGALTEVDPAHYGETVTLTFPTFTEAAEMAGISRVMGGYHIQADNIAGLELGRDVARHAWEFYRKHLGKSGGS